MTFDNKSHDLMMQTSDELFSLLQKKKISEMTAFLSLCMCVARLSLALGKDLEVSSAIIKLYHKACVRTEEKQKENKMLN